MVELKSISRHFDGKTVFNGLSHTFPDKGIFALMGPSGCGKTTLLRLLAGLDKPNGGEILNNSKKVSVAFQEPRLLPWLNCEDNLKIVLLKSNNTPDIIQKWLGALELSEAAKQLPSALSGGMQQRLSLARALAFGGDLLLLDEPFSALDQPLKERLAPLLLKAAEDALVILVTHDPDEARMLNATVLECTPTALLHSGQTDKKEPI